MATPFGTDEILWYNVGNWGSLGYGAPNFGQNAMTLNSAISQLVQVVGRNLSAVMHSDDVDLRTPPSINTLMKVNKLVNRARTILAGRAVPPSKPRFEAQHVTPAPIAFLVYPVPYFQVRNGWLKEWCGYALQAISEMMQHTENRLEYEISTAFAGTIGQYLQRIYVLMATELFGIDRATAEAPTFVLTDAMLASYDPSKFFTATELIDTPPLPSTIPTENDLSVLTDGIPATVITGLARWPINSPNPTATAGAVPTAGGTTASPTSTVTVPAFAPAPGP